MLDLYPDLQAQAVANTSPYGGTPPPSEAPTAAPAMEAYTHPNPQTFSEAYQSAWNEERLFSQASAFANARERAMSNRAQSLEKLTGDQSLQPMLATKGTEGFNARLRQLQQEHPDFADQLEPWSDDQLSEEALKVSKEAREHARALNMRPSTWGSFAGNLAGSAAAWPTDLVNQITGIAGVAVAPTTILGALATEAGVNGAQQIVTEILGGPYRTKIEPEYFSTAEPYTNVAGAVVIGGAVGAVASTAGAVYRRFYKLRPDVPPAVRDAGNVVESEEFTQVTNPLRADEPGGAEAHRTAFARAIDQVAKGEEVDVSDIITPEMAAAAREIMTERTRRPVTFDDLPTTEVEQPAMSPVGRPPGTAEPIAAEPAAGTIVQPRPTDVEVREHLRQQLERELNPELMERYLKGGEPELDAEVVRNFDRLRAERPDLQVPIGTVVEHGETKTVTRSLDDIMKHVEEDELVAREVTACVGSQPGAAG